MWKDFWAAGGWGMHPTAIFGFALLVAAVLYAVRPDARRARLALTLGLVTFAAGLLGACTGIATTLHFLHQVEPAKQFGLMALGIAESLHDVVLALILVVLGGLIGTVGAARSRVTAATAA